MPDGARSSVRYTGNEYGDPAARRKRLPSGVKASWNRVGRVPTELVTTTGLPVAML